jgi:hypothetical protein
MKWAALSNFAYSAARTYQLVMLSTGRCIMLKEMLAVHIFWYHKKIMSFSYHFLCRSAYILNQDTLPLSYKSFLNKHGGKDLVVLHGVKEIVNHTPLSNLAGIEEYYKSVGVDLKLDPNMKVPCSVSTTDCCSRKKVLQIAIIIRLFQMIKT